MPTFLSLNGIEFPARDGTARVGAPEEIGEVRARSFGGSLLSSRRAIKYSRSVDSTPMSAADALAWWKLLTGEGHVWSFESSLYSSKGLGPNAGYAAALGTGSAKYGDGRLSVNATTGSITFAAQLGSTWTVAVWRKESGTFVHYVVRSDGAKWVGGSRNDAASTTWLAVSSGSLTLTETGGSARDFDDLVALPYSVPTAWPGQIFAAAAAFGDLPKHTATGDFFAAGSTSVLAEVGDTQVTQGGLSGTWTQNIHRISITLHEV